MRIAEPHIIYINDVLHVVYDQALISQLQVKRRLDVLVQAFLRLGETLNDAF